MTTEPKGYLYQWHGSDPPDLVRIGGELQQAGLLPTAASWWFGWHELAIQLPGRLRDLQAVPATWDVIHLFSPSIEVRWLRRGDQRQVVLLTEQTLSATLTAWQPLPGQGGYAARPTTRILWGNRLDLLGEAVRGVIQFPRRLDYDLPDETEKLDQAIMAEVWAYYDDEARLQTVRYARLLHHPLPDNPTEAPQGST